MKKLLISISLFILGLVFVLPTKAYAYYNVDLKNDKYYTYEIIDNGTLSYRGGTYYYKIMKMTFSEYIDKYSVFYFSSSQQESTTNDLEAWVVTNNNNTLTAENFEKSVTINNYFDSTLHQYSYESTNVLYLHYLSVRATNTWLDSLRVSEVDGISSFFEIRYSQNMLYETGYNQGYNDAEEFYNEIGINQYNQGFQDGVNSNDESILALTSFIPKILGSVWNFVYVIGTFNVPFINISLIDVFLLTGGIGLIVVLIKLLL